MGLPFDLFQKSSRKATPLFLLFLITLPKQLCQSKWKSCYEQRMSDPSFVYVDGLHLAF